MFDKSLPRKICTYLHLLDYGIPLILRNIRNKFILIRLRNNHTKASGSFK